MTKENLHKIEVGLVEAKNRLTELETQNPSILTLAAIVNVNEALAAFNRLKEDLNKPIEWREI